MKTLTAIFGLGLLGISAAFAQQDIVSFNSTLNTGSTTGTFGFSFDVTSPITVTGLSVLTNTILAGGTSVGLWNSSKTELASAVIVAGDPVTSDGLFSYATLATPITLSDGTYYVGGEIQGGLTDYFFDTVGLSSVPNVTFLADAYSTNGSGLMFPDQSAGITAAQGGGDFGGNVVIGPTPAPDAGSSVMLLSVGMAGLAAFGRKKLLNRVSV